MNYTSMLLLLHDLLLLRTTLRCLQSVEAYLCVGRVVDLCNGRGAILLNENLLAGHESACAKIVVCFHITISSLTIDSELVTVRHTDKLSALMMTGSQQLARCG